MLSALFGDRSRNEKKKKNEEAPRIHTARCTDEDRGPWHEHVEGQVGVVQVSMQQCHYVVEYHRAGQGGLLRNTGLEAFRIKSSAISHGSGTDKQQQLSRT